ncbi:MAG: hypothetical protein FWF67_07250 [Fibromonadales bacterium]|nr:hypothetical protein [Fibromonadales bacterium]
MKTQLTKLAYAAGLVLAMTFIFPATSMAGCKIGKNTCSNVKTSSNGTTYSAATTCSNNATICSNGVLRQYGTVTCGGQTYKTVEIGKQIWMAENLNFDRQGNGWSVCYKEEFPYCEKYGRLYDWATAMDLPYKCNNVYSKDDKDCNIKSYQGICPCGWHIPTSAEWDTLYRRIDNIKGTNSPYSSPTAGKYLKATGVWESYEGKPGIGEDKFCFSALPGGGGFPANENFYYVGYNGFWWSASENPKGGGKHAYNQFMASNSDGAQGGVTYGDGVKTNLLSVRCVKD